MSKFIVSVLCAAVFFTGLGGLFEKASASFKSDDSALELLKKARAAVGGDAAIGGVRSMTITGKASKTLVVDGAARTESGEMEINFELPNKMSKQIKIGAGDNSNALVDKKLDVIVVRRGDGENLPPKVEGGDGVRQIIIKKDDGTTEEINSGDKTPFIFKRADTDTIVTTDGESGTVDGKKVFVRKMDGGGIELPRSNELFRTTLALLLTAPEGLDVTFTYVGEGSVDGTACEIIAANDGGSTVKLYLDKQTSLLRMMTFTGHKPVMIKIRKDETNDEALRTFERRAPEPAEFQVKFSDFRSVGGLQLPFKWTQTVGGSADEVIDITGYEVNPANIVEKFKEMPTRVFVRTKKEQ